MADTIDLLTRSYHKVRSRRVSLIASLGVLCVAAIIIDVASGPAGLSLQEVIEALVRHEAVSSTVDTIVWELRLPIALMALLTGAALAIAGAEMQTILRNPLADPFTLGVSSAAALGAALAIVFGFRVPGLGIEWAVSGSAFLLAFLSLSLLQAIMRLVGASAESIVLFGIALGLTSGAVLSFVQFFAPADSLQQLVFWSMGSVSKASWTTVGILGGVFAIIAPAALAVSWKLTALRLGEERAESFGVNVSRLRLFSLLRISLLAATAVSFVGIIGFVGLVAPHIGRMLVGDDHRFFLPASALVGALVMSFAAILSKSILPGTEIPVGILTSLVGLPFFLFLITRSQRRQFR